MKKLNFEKIDFQKQQLVLKDSNKDLYYIPVNDEVKNAIYKIEAEQNKIKKTNLSPKEIQRKIRAGFTPEQITQWTDLTLEDINRFAFPIEGEKVIAIKALQNLKLDKNKPFESVISIVSKVLSKKNASVNDIQWNAIKIDENPWQIEASYHDSNFEFDAKFLFDATKQVVEPLNQDANFLLDLEPDLEISNLEQDDNDSKIVSFDDQIKNEYESHNSDKSTIIYPPEKEAEVKVDKVNIQVKKENENEKSIELDKEIEKDQTSEKIIEEAPDRTTVITPEIVEEPQSDKTEIAKSIEENGVEDKFKSEKSASEAKLETKPETKSESEKSPSKSQRMKVPSWDDIMLGGSETQV